VATRGVTVNAICPGYVWTELIEKQLESSAASRVITPEQLISEVLLRPQPLGRFVTVRSACFVTVRSACFRLRTSWWRAAGEPTLTARQLHLQAPNTLRMSAWS
jgi:NAD(P)-dependent dehydrogenase (short-subunit alcohol dehydrogenase family)